MSEDVRTTAYIVLEEVATTFGIPMVTEADTVGDPVALVEEAVARGSAG